MRHSLTLVIGCFLTHRQLFRGAKLLPIFMIRQPFEAENNSKKVYNIYPKFDHQAGSK